MFTKIMEIFKENSWYENIGIIVNFLVTLFVVFIILVLFVEVAKAVFAVNFGAIVLIIGSCIDSGQVNGDTIGLIVLLVVTLLIVLFLLCCNDEYYAESVVSIFFDALLEGTVTVVALFAMVSIVFMPLAIRCWNSNDRY